MKLFFRAILALILTPIVARAVPVRLRVADANGQPIAGAQVEYIDYANLADEEANAVEIRVNDQTRGTTASNPRDYQYSLRRSRRPQSARCC